MNITLCFIKELYFKENAHFIKMLDTGNTVKQSHRTHLCVQVLISNNIFYLPLRNNLGDDVRKFGRIGHAIPSLTRPNAGIDYRYALLINDSNYIDVPSQQRIPNSQYQKIILDYPIIQKEFEQYLNGFLKAARKKRIDKEPLFRESCLVNFLKELEVHKII